MAEKTEAKLYSFRVREVDFVAIFDRRTSGSEALNETLSIDSSFHWKGISYKRDKDDLIILEAGLAVMPDGFDESYIEERYKKYMRLHGIKKEKE